MEFAVKVLKTAGWTLALIFAGTAAMNCIEAIGGLWEKTGSISN